MHVRTDDHVAAAAAAAAIVVIIALTIINDSSDGGCAIGISFVSSFLPETYTRGHVDTHRHTQDRRAHKIHTNVFKHAQARTYTHTHTLGVDSPPFVRE